MKVAVVHPGTQHSWQTAKALQDLGLLEFYATSIFYQPERWPYRIERYLPRGLRAALHKEFRRAEHPGLDPGLVKTGGLIEWCERLMTRRGFRRTAVALDRIGNRRFARLIDREIHSPAPFALWGYNSSSLESFLAAGNVGRRCILDRTIGDWRFYNEIMRPVFDAYGDWFHPGDREMGQYMIERDDAEYEAADLIVCGSEHCAATVVKTEHHQEVLLQMKKAA